MVSTGEVMDDGIVYKVRCLKCKWEGEVKIAAIYQTKVASTMHKPVSDKEKP